MSFDGRLLGGIGVMAAVVESGAFARAGEVLGLSQSGVSRSIARLEQRVGVRLFHRTARAVSLTEEGRRFFEQVRPLLAGIEDAASLAAGAASLVRGRLRINSDAGFGQFVLAPNLPSCFPSIPSWRSNLPSESVRATWWPMGSTWPSVSASRNRPR